MKKTLLCTILILTLMPVCLAQTGVYRALCVTNAHYDDGRVRLGGLNSAQGMYDCLSRSFGSQGSFISSLGVDMEKAVLLDYIGTAFSEAQEGDTSLFYINAHGGYQLGVAWLETREGGRIYAHELEERLRSVPGSVILIIDACNSGAFMGSASEFSAAFSAAFASDSFASDKYTVITSCFSDENSYRVTADTAIEKNIATVFARSFCEGLGWDLISDRSTALKADADHDRRVSVNEICAYVRRRCMFYLNASRFSIQTLNASVSNPALILADRQPAAR